MNGSDVALAYYWTECGTHVDGKFGGPSAGLLILFITYCFEFLVGAPSNLWLICHILRKRSKVAGILPADFFPFHLALSHVLSYLVLPPFVANHYLWQSDILFDVVTFLSAMVVIMKPLLLCLVCVERYIAVVRPLDYLRFKAHWYRWACLGVTWCIYILLASTALFERSVLVMCILFLPVFIIDTFCCLSILKTLQKPPPGDKKMMEMKVKMEEKRKAPKNESRVGRMEEGKQEQSRRKEKGKEEKVKKVERSGLRGKGEMNSMKKKAFITIAIIQAVLTLNNLPLIITLIIARFVPAQTLKCQYVAISIAAAASCSYLQPLLYMHRLNRLPCMTSQNT